MRTILQPGKTIKLTTTLAFFTGVVLMGICAAGTWVSGPDFEVWTFINRNYVQILTSSIIISYALAAWVYLKSFSVKAHNREQRELAAGGHTGNMLYDFFIGRELNPRVVVPYFGEVDIKAFMELRPGMLGWVMLDLAFAAKQYKAYGFISDSMRMYAFSNSTAIANVLLVMVIVSQLVYVFDALYMEQAILTTIDITTDGFGFMLSFGDLVWVPFIYSLQAKYLSVHPVSLGPFYVLLILAIQASGYYIFRASNSQKNRFRTDPYDPANSHLTSIKTANGSRLLTSGWWGKARHINYLGDWFMSWSYCLPTLAAGYKLTPSILYPGSRLVSTEGMKGWAIPITYFYLIYFAVLLVHRERRDEEKCRRKYGKDWDEYCRQVPSRIIPGVY